METHALSFFQTHSYTPSFADADQAKIEDYFTLGTDSLNTPNIDPDFFITEANLFRATSDKIDFKPTKTDPIDEFSYVNDISLNQQSNSTESTFDRSVNNYSPYSDKQLESSAININSPEMMPVSPNKVCPMDSIYTIEDDPTALSQMIDYENTIAMYNGSPATSSTSNSRSGSISSGCGDMINYDWAVPETVDHNQMYRVPQSPASNASYSTDSSKNYINLDQVQAPQMIQIKQEIDTSCYPTVIEELESTGLQYQSQMQQLPQSSYSTINQSDITYYQYPVHSNSLPSTVNTVLQQQVQQQRPSVQTTGNRKRNANAAFTATTSSAASTSGSKKPRMTKREKQKMMESDISKFETENRDLRTSIDLLERQITFCKRFLSENVAPVIQRQQQMNQFGSPQMVAVAVNEM